MSLRGQLLVYFLSIIILALLVFGLIAIYFSRDATLVTEQTMLTRLVQEKARTLSLEHIESPALSHIKAYFSNIDPEDRHAVFLAGQLNKILAPKNARRARRQYYSGFPFPRILSGPELSGSINQDGKLYLWSRAPVKGSPYQILNIYRSTHASSLPGKTLTTRLLVTGLFIAWMAVWVALIISFKVSKRLNRQSAKLEYQAKHDSLTGLPNRHSLVVNLELALKEAKERGSSLALLIMDLDSFKEINDTLGHDFGDLLLKEVGKRLRETMRSQDTVSRLGGDEFAVVLPLTNVSVCLDITDNVIKALADPFRIAGTNIHVRVSAGIAIYPEHGATSHNLIKHAEVAMYHAKHRGDIYAVYNQENDPHSVEKLTLTEQLHHATEKNELVLYYQPKVDLKKNLVMGLEALCRWQHPNQGMISPTTFIPLAEQTGIIKPITLWGVDSVLQQCKRWFDMGTPIKISLNLSARLLHYSELPMKIGKLLDLYEINHQCLELEITETAIMMDTDRARDILTQLHAMGVKLSIDDFGTGYTSLSQLKKLPIDNLKIDMSFVRNMRIDESNRTIVKSTIDLSHNMGLEVTAEGVEDTETYDLLVDMGCDYCQGYLISEPLPMSVLERWMAQSPWCKPKSGNIHSLSPTKTAK